MAVSFPLQPEIYLPLASFQWVSCLSGNQVEMFNNSYIGKCSVTTIYSYSKHHQPSPGPWALLAPLFHSLLPGMMWFGGLVLLPGAFCAVVIPILCFPEQEWGPLQHSLLPTQWHVLLAHRGKECLLEPWEEASQSFFPQTRAGGGSWGFRKHPLGSNLSLQFWGQSRDWEEVTWHCIWK